MVDKPPGATSYKDTAQGILPRDQVVKLEIEGVKRGLEWVYTQLKAGKTLIITPEFICLLHNICFGWIFPEWAGKFRLIQVIYSGKEAPPYYQLPEMVDNLCLDLAERIKHLPSKTDTVYTTRLIDLLSWFQHRFVFIHPFQDYNGRLARLLTTVILLCMELPPIEIDVDAPNARQHYLAAMQAADDGNYEKLKLLLMNALTEAYEALG